MDEDAELQLVLEISRREEEERQARFRAQNNSAPEHIVLTDSEPEEIPAIPARTEVKKIPKRQSELNSGAGRGRQVDQTLRNGVSSSLSPTTVSRSLLPRGPAFEESPSNLTHERLPESRPINSHPGPSNGALSTFLADRAQMERERLARQKRLRPQLQQHDNTDSEEEAEPGPPPKRAKVETEAIPESPGPSAYPAAGISTTSSSTEPMFWEGEIRQTANRHAQPSKDLKPVWRLSEILGKRDQIKLIIFASYCNDIDWILRVFPEDVPIIFVGQPGDDGRATVHNILPNWIKATPFLPNGRGCMHMKFMLVFYSTGRLRLMISTANFVDYDWRDIENTAWVQDIPLRPKAIEHDPQADDFAGQFQQVLGKLNLAPALQSHLKGDHPHLPLRSINELRARWDWSKITVKLVVSVAGKYQGLREVAKSGHTNLSKAILELGAACPEGKDISLECQGSSIGTYSASWLNEFVSSAKGQPLSRWFSWKTQQPRGKIAAPSPSRLKILFPSLRTVDASALKRPGGGTMFCKEKQWGAKTFPRQLFYDSKSKRGGILMHSKMILAIFSDKPKATSLSKKASGSGALASSAGGWCYIGSHNFTPSAWGNLSGLADSPIMNVTNYEMGIVVPLPAEDTEEAASKLACWERPASAYQSGVDEPWMQDKHILAF